ncbi:MULTISPECIES: hypothetical protein [Bacillaceae]|uniref:hypothetical protein n=1 Tax=Bacillaceae TaxID=186817 RepID=UPI001046DF66|nr:hypothetical protein [Bacillus sp. CBEL-1]TDB53146.1 hypothetical protein EPL02_06510 [Bacillus sp. CBEL-1]
MKNLLGSLIGIAMLAGCSSTAASSSLDKGIESLGKKDYHQASVYFESAMNEKGKNSEQASVYFNQASEMKKAVEAYEEGQYDVASIGLEKVISEAGMTSVKEEAKVMLNNIREEEPAELEAYLQKVEELMSAQQYKEAEEKMYELHQLSDGSEYPVEYIERMKKINEELSSQLTTQAIEPVTTKKPQSPGYTEYVNSRYGFSIQYPSEFETQPPPTNGDGAVFYSDEVKITAYAGHTNIIQPNETVMTYYDEELNQISNIAYKRQKDNWYVISYVENGMIVYKKFFFGDVVSNTFIITYPAEKKAEYDALVNHVVKTFKPNLKGE